MVHAFPLHSMYRSYLLLHTRPCFKMPSLCFVASLLVGTAVGSAITGTPYWNPSLSQSSWPTAATSSCLSGPQATSIVAKFESLLTGPQAPSFNATASALLANDFADTSDSIDSLAGYPVRFSCSDSSNSDLSSSVVSPSRRSRLSSSGKEHSLPSLTS